MSKFSKDKFPQLYKYAFTVTLTPIVKKIVQIGSFTERSGAAAKGFQFCHFCFSRRCLV